MARPTAGGRGTRTTLEPLPHTRNTRCPCFSPQVANVRTGGFEDPQAQQAEHGNQREVTGVGGLAGRSEQGFELQVCEPERR